MRTLKSVLLILLLTVAAVSAQENPSVDIVLSQSSAQQGDTIDADVYVRNGVNVGGVDVGIAVDEACLRILDRQPGGYLPTTDAEGAFSAFAELNEHDTRLAAALMDRTKYANGDGVFYRVPLEVTCEQGTAAVDVTYAQVSSYVDPSAEIIEVVSYDLDEGTLTASSAQLQIVAAGATQATEASTVAAPDQTTVAAPDEVTSEPGSTVQATPPATTQPAESTQSNTLWIVALLLIVAGFIGLGALYVVARRRNL
ncbi:MAG: hypothetical protein CL607_03180 [Anaerolineaceae bacterium]|nr:hypothetical protein [Anaerolineaceae bacterium]